MADDDQYALCWNNFNKNLTAGFHSLYSRGDFTDVSLSAGGQVLKAHRMVLSVCSPYFQAMFESTPPTQHPIIFLKDISYKNLSDLVQFMYCGEVHVKQDDLAGFIAIAESLQIKGLTESGGETNVSPDNTKLDTTGSRPLRAAKRSRKKQELEEVSCTPVKMEKRTINSRIRPGKKLSTNSQDPLQQDITSIPSTSTAEFIEMDALHTKTEPTTYDDQDMDSSYLQGDDTFNAADLVEKDDNYDNTYSEAEDTHEDKQPKEELNNTDTGHMMYKNSNAKVPPTVIMPSESTNTPIVEKVSMQKYLAPPTTLPPPSAEPEEANIFSGVFSQQITKENIIFMRQLLETIEKVYAAQNKSNVASLETVSLTNDYTTPGVGKVEISPNGGFYIRESAYSRIQIIYDRTRKWNCIVNETLLEVYDASIANYSATGKKGRRPAINDLLFKGLFDWVNRCEKGAVSRQSFINSINKYAYNKRKSRKRRNDSTIKNSRINSDNDDDDDDGENEENDYDDDEDNKNGIITIYK